MDFTRDQINILGQEIDPNFLSSGHYTISISKTYEALNKFDENNTESILGITTKH